MNLLPKRFKTCMETGISRERETDRQTDRESENSNSKTLHKQSEGLGGVVWVYKIGLKWPVVAMAITLKPQSLSLSLRETENWNSSSKTLFYKDCSLGSVKNPSNNKSLRSYWWVNIKLQASFIYIQACMCEWNLIHENFHTKHSVFTAPDVHMHTSLSYTLWACIQPVYKAVEHLINSTPVLGGKEEKSSQRLHN